MPNAALPVVERAAKRNAGWAKALLPQLERLTGRLERAPEAPLDALPEELRSAAPFKKKQDFWSPEFLPQILLCDGGGALPSASVDVLGQALAPKATSA